MTLIPFRRKPTRAPAFDADPRTWPGDSELWSLTNLVFVLVDAIDKAGNAPRDELIALSKSLLDLLSEYVALNNASDDMREGSERILNAAGALYAIAEKMDPGARA